MNRLEEIRRKEKQYHDSYYNRHQLFEEGTWLHKPVKTIMELMDLFDERTDV